MRQTLLAIAVLAMIGVAAPQGYAIPEIPEGSMIECVAVAAGPAESATAEAAAIAEPPLENDIYGGDATADLAAGTPLEEFESHRTVGVTCLGEVYFADQEWALFHDNFTVRLLSAETDETVHMNVSIYPKWKNITQWDMSQPRPERAYDTVNVSFQCDTPLHRDAGFCNGFYNQTALSPLDAANYTAGTFLVKARVYANVTLETDQIVGQWGWVWKIGYGPNGFNQP